MDWTLKPTLENIAVVKVASMLLNWNGFREQLFQKCPNEWKKIGWSVIDEVVDKASKISLPEQMISKVSGIIKPIGEQFFKWINVHRKYCLCIQLPIELSWTSYGTVDEKKTAELLIKDVSIDVCERYELACTYCLEVDIPKLWRKIPEYKKEIYVDRELSSLPLIDIWTCIITGKIHSLIIPRITEDGMYLYSPYQYAYKSAIETNNKAATEYLFQKLTLREKEESFKRIKPHEARIICYLLSQMNEEQQSYLLRNLSVKAACSFLNWPWQFFFVDVARYMSKKNGIILLSSISFKMMDPFYKDFNYSLLFEEFWKHLSSFKRLVIDEHFYVILSNLFNIKNIKNIKLIFQVTTPINRKKFLLSFLGYNICKTFISIGEWDLLKFLIRECTLSRNEMVQFKKPFKQQTIEKDKIDKFFTLLDDQVRDKRSYIEERKNKKRKKE